MKKVIKKYLEKEEEVRFLTLAQKRNLDFYLDLGLNPFQVGKNLNIEPSLIYNYVLFKCFVNNGDK